MTKIDLNNLDKSTWETFEFEEIAFKISETVDPNKTDLPIYVGLEHLDAEDIHIRRTGTPDDVNGQKLKCYPGDVIFGKRRAYQRKAAIVDFEGICSAHAFVLRANPEVIDPKLFPFFLHSDQFMHRAVDISVGGLSPTINWGDLKHQEFLLPPKDQQAQLAELLWAMDEVIEVEKRLIEHIDNFILCLQNKIWESNKACPFGDKFDLLGGFAFKSNEFVSDGIPVVKIKDIIEQTNTVAINEITDFIKEESLNTNQKYVIKKDDILIGLTGAKSGSGYVGKIGIIDSDIDFPILLNQRVAKIISNCKYNNSLNRLIFTSYKFLKDVWNRSNEGAQANISTTDLKKCQIPDVFEDVEYYNKTAEFIYNSKEVSESKLLSSQSLQKSLINQVF